jgi:ribosomal protein S18 acetylase RimI-like enzyme
MVTIDIRIAEEKDIPALQGFYKSIGHTEEGYFSRCLQEQASGSRKIFIAQKDNMIVGYVQLNFAPRYALYKKLDIPEIQDLNVAPAHRRQGIGRALVEYCEKQCESEQVGISVGLTKDYGAAQRLYMAMGYVADGMGVTYDREPVSKGQMYSVDDDLCLMMVKQF